MPEEFSLSLRTPQRLVLTANVSEVVVPAFDGECGVLADHEDYVGLLGLGPLGFVEGGKKRHCLISSGVFQVENGDITILTERAELAEEIDCMASAERMAELEKIFGDPVRFRLEDYPSQKLEYELMKARVETCKRVSSV